MILPLYVDDGRLYYKEEARGHAEWVAGELTRKFKIQFGSESPAADYFLGGNRKSSPDGKRVTVSATSHIDAMVERFLPGGVDEYPSAWGETPADDTLQQEWAKAVASRPEASRELVKRYGSLFGALLYTIRFRPDVCASLSLLGSCLTFPTEALYACATRVLV